MEEVGDMGCEVFQVVGGVEDVLRVPAEFDKVAGGVQVSEYGRLAGGAVVGDPEGVDALARDGGEAGAGEGRGVGVAGSVQIGDRGVVGADEVLRGQVVGKVG